MFDAIADRYQLLNHVLSLGMDRYWRRYTAKRLQPSCQGRLLDLCGGTGDLARAIVRRCPETRVCVGDFSLTMLQQGSRPTAPEDQRLDWVALDALNLPISSRLLDLVTCAFGVRNWESLEDGLAEVGRVLREQGEFAVLDFFAPPRHGWQRYWFFVVRVWIRLVARLLTRRGDAYVYLGNSIDDFVTVERFVEVARQHGFQLLARHAFAGRVCHLVHLQRTVCDQACSAM